MQCQRAGDSRNGATVAAAPGVLAAGDGEEALRLVEQERPSLAVLEVVMPKVGGTAVAGRLAERYPNLPVIFTSGYSQDTVNLPNEGQQMKYLQKPYSPTALSKLVRNIIGRKRSDRPELTASRVLVQVEFQPLVSRFRKFKLNQYVGQIGVSDCR